MPYIAPTTKATGDLVTAAIWNQDVVDNENAAFPTGVAAWTSWTPTLTQSGAVTKTATYAKYQRVGRFIVAQIDLACTGAGTAANRVIVGTPVTAAASGFVVGSGYIYDTSANLFYIGVAVMLSTTTLALMGTGAVADYLGAAGFTAALAAGDLVRLSVTFEAAT